MPNTFLASDTHLGHALMARTRPWSTVEEHDEKIIENWNKVVRHNDTVIHLGDVVMNRRCLITVSRLNGKKILVKGNHDVFRVDEYRRYFDALLGCKVIQGAILTHIPVHPDQLTRFETNVHGHLHGHEVMLNGQTDPRYLCVSMENIGYTPISLEEARVKLKERAHAART